MGSSSNRINQLIQPLTISVLLHLILILLMHNKSAVVSFQDTEPVEVEILDGKPKHKDKQFVMDANAGQIVAKSDSPARFVSQFNRRVKEESVAQLSGPSRNASMSSPKKSLSSAQRVLKDQKLEVKDLLPDGEVIVGNRSQRRSADFTTQQSGESTISEYIPGVRTGRFTALNTDQITYYTFFARINEQLRPRWVNNIRRVSSTKSQSQLKQWSRTSRITEIEIILDKRGYFLKSRLFKQSGVEDLDWAATDAFRDAAPFINPPTELVGDDGLVRLQYSFFVEWQSFN